MPMVLHRKNDAAQSIAIVGAGIVGCAAALALVLDGHQVTLFDPDAPGAGTSSGNAGGIVTGSVTPTATPDVLRALPSILFDRSSPAVLRLRHSLKVLPWLSRFVRAGLPGEMNRIAAALHLLVSGSLIAHRSLAAQAGAAAMVTQEGWLKVFASQQAYAATALDRRLMDRFGVDYAILDHKAVTDLEPGLNPALCAIGFYQPGCGFVRYPKGLAQAYFDAAARQGAIHLKQHVRHVTRGSEGGVSVRVDDATHGFDKLVVAAGAWSASLVRQLGDRVSLDTEARLSHRLWRTDGRVDARSCGAAGDVHGSVTDARGSSARQWRRIGRADRAPRLQPYPGADPGGPPCGACPCVMWNRRRNGWAFVRPRQTLCRSLVHRQKAMM